MKNLKKLLAAVLLCSLFLMSCNSPQKLIESGNYDDTIDLCIKRIAGKKKKDPKYVLSLENAFEKATKADMREIEALKRSGRADIWESVLSLQEDIQIRQNKIQPLLPVVDKKGFQASFSFVRVDDMIAKSKAKAADYYYTLAATYFPRARAGSKYAARDAYKYLSKTKRFYDSYKDRTSLMNEMHGLGLVHILYTTKNSSRDILPADFERELMNVSVKDFNTHWNRYYSKEVPSIDFDFRVDMNISAISISPEEMREREYVDRKEIKDGFTYVLDSNGNVMKDTLGNDIKIDRFVWIEAWVLETFQHKSARVKGRLEYFDAKTNELIYTDALNAEAIFDNYASTFRGDRRALTSESRHRIGNSPRPFPSNVHLIMEAGRNMKPYIKEKMSRRNLMPRIIAVADN